MLMTCLYHSYTIHRLPAPYLSALQGDGKGGSGVVNLDLELLKPCKVSAVTVGSNVQERIERAAPADRVWLEYAKTNWGSLTRKTHTGGVHPS